MKNQFQVTKIIFLNKTKKTKTNIKKLETFENKEKRILFI